MTSFHKILRITTKNLSPSVVEVCMFPVIASITWNYKLVLPILVVFNSFPLFVSLAESLESLSGCQKILSWHGLLLLELEHSQIAVDLILVFTVVFVRILFECVLLPNFICSFIQFAPEWSWPFEWLVYLLSQSLLFSVG